MNITIRNIENVLITEDAASGKISFEINGKSVDNAVYIYDMKTGCTIIKQSGLRDGHELGGSHFLVDEYCHACEAAQAAIEVMLSKRQDSLALDNIRVSVYDTLENGDILGDFSGLYFVEGTSYKIKNTLFHAFIDIDNNISVELVQNPYDTHWCLEDHVKSGVIGEKEQAYEMIETALAEILKSKSFESIEFYDKGEVA